MASEAPPSVMTATTITTTGFAASDRGKILAPPGFKVIFSVYDAALQFGHMPIAIVFILFIYTCYQIIVSSFWQDQDLMSVTVGFWLSQELIETNLITYFVVFSVLFLISLSFLLGPLIYYYRARQTVNWSLFFCRFFNETIVFVILYPISSFLGKLIVLLAKAYSNLALVATIFCFVYYFYFAAVLFMFYSFSCSSAYLENNFFISFEPTGFRSFFLLNTVLIMLQSICVILPSWTFYFVFAAQIFILLLALFKTMFFPFKDVFSNVVVNTTLITSIALSVLKIVFSFIKNLPDHLLEYISIPVFVIGAIVIYVIYDFRTKKLMRLLCANEVKPAYLIEENNEDGTQCEKIDLSNEEKNSRFNTLRIDSHAFTLLLLHIGLEKMCDLFIDFSFIKFLLSTEPATPILMDVLRFVIFFPGEYRIGNLAIGKAYQRRNLSFHNKFLLYQIKKIVMRRQSSSSHQSKARLNEIKMLSKNCESDVMSYFAWKDPNPVILYKINNQIRHIHSMWDESLDIFANSTYYHSEFARFLIECETDFTKAICEEHKRQMIESGANFSNDICFKMFVQSYPQYLKKKLIDKRGYFIRSKIEVAGTQNSTKTSEISSLSDMDQKIEEEIGKTILTQAKVRLALQNALENKKARNSLRIMIFSGFYLLCGIVLPIIMFTLFLTYFNPQRDAQIRAMKSTFSQTYSSVTSLLLLFEWGNKTGHIVVPAQQDRNWYSAESKDGGLIFPQYSYEDNSRFYLNEAQLWFEDFISDFASESDDEEELARINTIGQILVENVIPIKLCSETGKPAKKATSYNLRGAMSFNFMNQRILSASEPYTDWFAKSPNFCHIYQVVGTISQGFNMTRLLIVDDIIERSHNSTAMFKTMIYVMPAAYFAVFYIISIVFVLLYMHEIRKFAGMILDFDRLTLENASKPIRTKCLDDQTEITASHSSQKNNIAFLYAILLLILIGCFSAILAVSIDSLSNLNDKLMYCAKWSYWSAIRTPIMFEVCISIMLAIFSSGTNPQRPQITNYTVEVNNANMLLRELESASTDLIIGDGEFPSLHGFDESLETLFNSEQCPTGTSNPNRHDTYRCASSTRMATFFIDMAKDILADVTSYDGDIEDEIPLEMCHLVLRHLANIFLAIDQQFIELAQRFIDNNQTTMILCLVFGIVISIITYTSIYLLNMVFDGIFSGGLIMLRRISPASIIVKAPLFNYLMGNSTTRKKGEMSTTEAIVHNSQDAILCVNLSMTIDIMNPSVSSLLGYTPDQMLGQSVINILEESCKEEIRNQLQLMADRQSALVYESSVTCVNDNDRQIPCSITILGVPKNDHVDSFVVILRDESELVLQRQIAEIAKAQSESLLYQILPRNIVNQINSGEKDISFIVQSASVSFIDIVKFSDFAKDWSPQEIMGNLSAIFGSFDELLPKFPLVTKIKLIGDVYMSASGLFAKDEPPSSHAEQMVRFTIAALQALDDANMKLNVLLNVRIGINSGGPIIAGVLGTDKPTFDIIGDPINIASRLQSTDIPGKVQISKSTYELVGMLDFHIEPRGEVFLKGKGKTEAFIVSPPMAGYQLTSDISDMSDNKLNFSSREITVV